MNCAGATTTGIEPAGRVVLPMDFADTQVEFADNVLRLGLRLPAAPVTTPHAFHHRYFDPHRRTAFDRQQLGADRARRARRLRRPQRRRQIDAVSCDPRRTADRNRHASRIPPRWRIGSLAQEAPDGPESLIEVVLKADLERDALLQRSRNRPRPAPDRRNPDPARRYRRALRAGARGGDPERPRVFDRRSGAAMFGILRRLAHAGGARGDAVRGARSAAAGRADQLSRPRRHAVAGRSSGELSAHRDRHQP